MKRNSNSNRLITYWNPLLKDSNILYWSYTIAFIWITVYNHTWNPMSWRDIMGVICAHAFFISFVLGQTLEDNKYWLDEYREDIIGYSIISLLFSLTVSSIFLTW